MKLLRILRAWELVKKIALTNTYFLEVLTNSSREMFGFIVLHISYLSPYKEMSKFTIEYVGSRVGSTDSMINLQKKNV